MLVVHTCLDLFICSFVIYFLQQLNFAWKMGSLNGILEIGCNGVCMKVLVWML